MVLIVPQHVLLHFAAVTSLVGPLKCLLTSVARQRPLSGRHLQPSKSSEILSCLLVGRYRWNRLGLTYFLTRPCRRYGWTTTMRPVAMARVRRLPYCVSFSRANCHSIAHTAVTNTLERPEPPISKFLISNVQLTGCSNYGDGAKCHDGATIISLTFDLGILLRLPDVSGTSTRQDVLSKQNFHSSAETG